MSVHCSRGFCGDSLNRLSIDVLALELSSNRNAIYKNLFEARRNLRESTAAAGHQVLAEDTIG
jgi:RNA polymerase sigma-70 factor, ECF subfamily